jgi:hypothetical protein
MNRRISSLFLYTDEKAVYASFVLTLVCFFAYIYFVSVSIVEVVVREELVEKVGEVATGISVRESEYIALKASINESEMERMGLASLSGKTYVTVKVASLSLNQ